MGVNWYPEKKCSSAQDCPAFVCLDIFESEQVQEAWAIEGNVGPEVMIWLDGSFHSWWPKLTMDRAVFFAAVFFPHAQSGIIEG